MNSEEGTSARACFKTSLSEIPKMQEMVEAFIEEAQVPMDVGMRLVLVVEELFTNIIMYGHDDSDLHEVEIELSRSGETLECEIVDDGKPFNPTTQAPDVDTEKSLEERGIGGLGIHFAKTFMDEIAYVRDDDKNKVRLRKVLP